VKKISDTDKWRILLRNLRKHFPARYPICVWHYPSKGNFGITRFDGKKFLVRISSLALSIYQRDALVHEWAHCMVNDWARTDAEYHGPVWGAYYAMIYTAWMSDFKEPTK